MKFSVQKSDVLDVLSKVQGLTGRKSNLAITSTVLIESSDNKLKLSATDLETAFEGYYPASVETDGMIALNARKLYEIVRDFPDGSIFFNEVENHWIQIGNDMVEYNIVGLNPDDFPKIPVIKDQAFFEIKGGDLKQMIERCLVIGGASDEKRAHILGLLLEVLTKEDATLMRLVATDGSRLSYSEDKVTPPAEYNLPPIVLVPKKGLNEVVKFLDTSESVHVSCRDNHFVVQKENQIIMIRLLEGDFPKYEDVLGVRSECHSVQLSRMDFLMMLKRMSILSSDSYKGVIFKLSEDQLEITSTNPEIGESKEDMPIAYSGPNIEAAFNPRFFIDSLNLLEDETVLFKIIDDERPSFVEGEKERNYLSIIMPMRI